MTEPLVPPDPPCSAIDSVYNILDEMEDLLVLLREKASDLAREGAYQNGE